MRNKKPAMWRGLTSVLCIVLALSMILGGVLEANAGTIDTYLGTQSSKTVSEHPEDLYTKYKPDAAYLNEDGTGNSTALIQAAIDLGRREGAEGAVLLKNDNGALPLASGSAVTLLGIRSHSNLIGSSFGVKAQGPYITLEQALSKNITDFKNTIAWSVGSRGGANSPTTSGWNGGEFEFDGAGYTLNETMIGIYDKLKETYVHYENEPAAEVYDPGEPSIAEIAAVNGDYKSSFATYGDAAIVVIARPSCEQLDYMPGGTAEGVEFEHGEPLSLTKNELDLIELAKEASDTVIVLLQSSVSVEIGTLKNDPEVDAILWAGVPGNYGFLGIADVLCGKVSPSGGLFDIFTAYNMSAPAMQNFGRLYYANTEGTVTRSGGVLGFNPGAYAIEAEGIYVGYRYYETRYYDAVAGVHNATSTKGAYGSQGEWSYADEVTYGFGYGLSYTTFDFDMGEPVWDVQIAENGAPNIYVTFPVTVTNTGKVAGKTPVQIYGQAPYIEGGVEKSAIQLLNFEKSPVIEPGQSAVVEVKVDMQYIASYDMNYKNADGTTGTYILDPGSYYFAVGNGAHEALNSIMLVQGMDETKMVGTGDTTAVYTKDITEDFISKTAFSISKTGHQISNQIPYSDWNYYQPGEVVYLSRADWDATWPKQYHNMELTSDLLIDHLNGVYYELQTGDDTSSVVWGVDHGIHITDMYGVAYDDPKWDQLLEQLTLEEAMYIFTFGGPSIPGAASIGAVETYMTENAGNGVAVALNATKDPDAPWAIPVEDPNGLWHPEVFANAPMGCASFNPDLMYELGAFTGLESLFTGINILWGPGLNTHRHAYNGRSGEYYSEDPILSGVAAMEFAIGAHEYGLIASPKHFAFNDQETDRGGVSPWMTEQRAREVELRAYQYAFEATKYDTPEYNAGMRGLMTSFSKIGGVECTCSYGLMTEILANEWGFIGYGVTDIYDDVDLWAAVLNSGTTCFDTRGQAGFYGSTTLSSSFLFTNQINEGRGLDVDFINGDLNLQLKLKEAVHKNIFAWSESHVMNRYAGETHVEQLMPWWRTTYYAAIGVSAVLMALCAVMYVMNSKKDKAAPAGAILYFVAAALGIVGIIGTVVCNNISADNALSNLPLLIAVGVVGVVLAAAAAIVGKKNDLVRAVAGLGAIAAFMFVLNSLISERVMLVAGLFSFNAGNEIGWQVFYATIVGGVAMLLAAIVIAVAAFAKGKKVDVAA